MIHRLTIKDPKATPIEFWSNIPWLKSLTQLDFKPGLNIIIGPNGSGKSTLLKALAMITHCRQSGISTITQASCRELTGRRTNKVLDGIQIESNGTPTGYFTPEEKPGLIGGMAGFDYDFLAAGVYAATFKGSSGENTMQFYVATIEKLLATKSITTKTQTTAGHDFAFTSAKPSPEPPTILLDEPERAISLTLQGTLWAGIENIASGRAPNPAQIIVATHSPLCLFRNANYIETKQGFLNELKAVMTQEATRILENRE